MVLENPIAPDKVMLFKIVKEFDLYCRSHGLRTAYYRIPEMDKEFYERLGKKLLPIGEEAVVQLDNWTLEGGDKKGLRNSMSKLTKQDYQFKVNPAPQTDAFIQQLRAVSDEWLTDMKRKEIVFSQGAFDEKVLKHHTILSLQTSEGKVEGFVNLIPDYTPGEANFDLMRKTAEAPNGTMDFILVKMFEYLKSLGFRACNMGMVPMSGIDDPENLQERVIKLGYERIRQFGHYKSLHDFKDKFQPQWQMMYLAYSAAYDLIYLPGALEQVVEP
jgi:phosphatidylglycerol lysyltransferase